MSVRDFPPRQGHPVNDPENLVLWLDKIRDQLNTDALVEVTTPAAGDELRLFDSSANAHRKIQLTNLFIGLALSLARLLVSSRVVVGTVDLTPSAGGVGFINSHAGGSYAQFDMTGTTGGSTIGSEGANFIIYTYTGAVGSETYAQRVNISSSALFTVPFEATTVKSTNAAGFISSDGSTGYTGTVTTASLVGKTITIKDGIITGFA